MALGGAEKDGLGRESRRGGGAGAVSRLFVFISSVCDLDGPRERRSGPAAAGPDRRESWVRLSSTPGGARVASWRGGAVFHNACTSVSSALHAAS